MRIAYLILAHKNFSQLGLLAKTLKVDWSDIFIHVDARSRFEESAFKRTAQGTKVCFVEPRLKVYWGHVSVIHATLALLKQVHAQSQGFDRVVLLSGQDFPIVSQEKIYSFFEEHQEIEFLEYSKFPIRWWPYGGWDRVSIYNFPDKLGPWLNRVSRVTQMALPFRRRNLRGTDVYGSSQWFNLTGRATQYILNQVATTDILRAFNYSYAADEVFFQTILLNSPFAEECVNRSLRYVQWAKGASGPRILVNDDLDDILQQSRCSHFARKFDSTVDHQVIDYLANLNAETSPLAIS